jgi:glutamate-1-semialdehyde 2,1-aminomutase
MIPSISEKEIELSTILANIIPSAEKIKLALTGTEVVNYSVKLAKYVTQREKILTINGSYHGSTLSFPDKVLEKYIDKVEFNDLESIEKKLESEEYAALILEPVMCNKGIIIPEENYLKSIKKLCKSSGTILIFILIFDEIVTGFRIRLSGAQEYYKVKPNISTFGKSMGNGIPVSSIVGKNLMDNFTPKGKVFFGGTFYSNLVSILKNS